MKRNEVKISMVFSRIAKNFPAGVAVIIGKRPTSIPYININDDSDRCVVSLNHTEMNSLIKKWKAANP